MNCAHLCCGTEKLVDCVPSLSYILFVSPVALTRAFVPEVLQTIYKCPTPSATAGSSILFEASAVETTFIDFEAACTPPERSTLLDTLNPTDPIKNFFLINGQITKALNLSEKRIEHKYKNNYIKEINELQIAFLVK